MNDSPQRTLGNALREFFGVPFRKQTYRNLAYLALAFPLGLVYFTGAAIGLSAGVGLVATLVGIPLLLLTLIGAIGAAGFEARLTSWLINVKATPPSSLKAFNRDYSGLDDVLEMLTEIVTTPTTWSGVLLIPLKLVFGVVALSALIVASTLSWTVIAAPLYYDLSGYTYTVGPYLIESLPEALGLSVVGIFLVLISLHVLNGLAKLGGFTTAVLLGDDFAQTNTALDTVEK